MTSYKYHQIFAFVLAGLLFFFNYKYNLFSFNSEQIVITPLILLIYSILPDIDTPVGKLRKTFTPAILLIIVITILLKLYFISLIAALLLLALSILKHRGRVHSLTAALAFSLPLLYYDMFYFVFALIGYSSHLLLDGKIKVI